MKALLLVDLQNDFLPGGALSVKEADKVLPVVNRLLEKSFDLIIATKDWHPQNHGSFAPVHDKTTGEHIILDGIEQILWPVHCVQGSRGSEFSKEWHSEKVHKIFYKGTEVNIDSYSTFFDNDHRRSTGLEQFLRSQNITDLYVAGLATDYCVKYSVLDALQLGFKTFVILDACQAVNLHKGDGQRAIEEMQRAGAKLITSRDLEK
jgi:nicotinamidase/pyrazinamidase